MARKGSKTETESCVHRQRRRHHCAMSWRLKGVLGAGRSVTARHGRSLRTTVPALRSKPALADSPDPAADTSSDAEVMSMLLDGQMPHHRLEAELGDATRAAGLRRTYVEATTAANESARE